MATKVRVQVLDHADRLLIRSTANVAEHLRRVADQIDREINDYAKHSGIDILSPDREHAATQLAHRVLHEVLWMVPNLHLDSLPQQAERVSRYYREVYGEEE